MIAAAAAVLLWVMTAISGRWVLRACCLCAGGDDGCRVLTKLTR